MRDRVRPPVGSCEEGRDGPSRAPASCRVGDAVWVRKLGSRCTERSRRGNVTATVSPQVVEVDGTPRHVRDLRSRNTVAGIGTDVSAVISPDPLIEVMNPVPLLDVVAESPPPEADGRGEAVSETRHSHRSRRPPEHLHYGESGTSETTSQWVFVLHQLASTCQIGLPMDEVIRDQVIEKYFVRRSMGFVKSKPVLKTEASPSANLPASHVM